MKKDHSYKSLKFLAVVFIALLGTGLAVSATTPDVSIGQNGIRINSGTLDMGGGDITDGSTTIWDASNGYIPAAQINDGSGSGLDADTLDGKNTSALTWADLGIAQTDVSKSDVGLGNVENIALSSATWTDIGIAKSDVSASDVGLGSVENENALAQDGSELMNGNLDLNTNNIVGVNELKIDRIYESGTSGNVLMQDNLDITGDYLQAKIGNTAKLNLRSNGDTVFTVDDDGDQGGTNTCTLDASDGSWDCTGTKNWVHQLNSTHEAVYTSQESPMVRAVYEGKAHVVDSKKIKLPSHFIKTVSNTEPMLRAQVTPQGTFTKAVVMDKTDDYIQIKVGKETDVNFRITGIREGYEDKQIVRKKK